MVLCEKCGFPIMEGDCPCSIQKRAEKQAGDGPEIRYLGDVQRLRVEPGDVIVVSTEQRLSVDEARRIGQAIQRVLPEGQRVLILDAGTKIGVIGADDGAG